MNFKRKLIAAPYIIWAVLFIAAPLVIVLFFAFTDGDGHFTFSNITGLGVFLPTFWYSLLLGALAALICLVIAYPAAYCISRFSENVRRFLIMLVLLPMAISFLLRTISWVALLSDNGYINRFLQSIGFGTLPLIRNPAAVLLGMVYNYLPYMILPIYIVLVKINPDLMTAANDLGAGKTQIFRRVTLPLTVPGILSGVMMVFVPAVSTFYISKKLGGAESAMIGDIIEQQFKTAYNPNLGAAMSLVLMIMIFVSMAIINRFAEKGGGEVTLL